MYCTTLTEGVRARPTTHLIIILHTLTLTHTDALCYAFPYYRLLRRFICFPLSLPLLLPLIASHLTSWRPTPSHHRRNYSLRSPELLLSIAAAKTSPVHSIVRVGLAGATCETRGDRDLQSATSYLSFSGSTIGVLRLAFVSRWVGAVVVPWGVVS